MTTPPPGQPQGPSGYQPTGYPGYGPPDGYNGGPPAYNESPAYGPPAGYNAGPQAYGPPPGYGAPNYGAPAGYGPPANYGSPVGYGPAPGYGHAPGYGPAPGYGAPAQFPQAQYPQYSPYGQPYAPGQIKPGIIPLRPLTLSDIFNGAFRYIRANPKATLGLTAGVVIVMQIISLIATLGPVAAFGSFGKNNPGQFNGAIIFTLLGSAAVSVLVSWLGSTLLSGMLTVIVGRAVFGSPITIGETWVKIRGRILALLGLALLEGAAMAALVGLGVVLVAMVAALGNAALAILVGFGLVILMVVAMVYLYTLVLFAPVLIVLERLTVFEAIARSFALVRNSFWRVLGIRMLTYLVVGVIANAFAAPFSLASQLMLHNPTLGMVLAGTALSSVGSAIAQIITQPFTAGVIVLLYTDRRIRSEAFDLVLQTGAAGGPSAIESTDNLWLTRPV